VNRFVTTRRSQWAPGVIVLATAAAIAAVLGLGTETRSWSVYAGLAALALLLIGGAERYWLRWAARRALDPTPRSRTKLKLVPGHKKGNGESDFEDDDPSSKQRWLM
jgi:hypothetical protein